MLQEHIRQQVKQPVVTVLRDSILLQPLEAAHPVLPATNALIQEQPMHKKRAIHVPLAQPHLLARARAQTVGLANIL